MSGCGFVLGRNHSPHDEFTVKDLGGEVFGAVLSIEQEDTVERLRALGQWLNENRDLGYDLVRIYLGVGLLIRGLLFIGDPTIRLQEMLTGPEPSFATAMVMHYVVLAHVAGGLLLMLGLLTRLAAAIQVPVLFGAVFFVHIQEGLFTVGQSLEFSALVLFLLVVFMLFGAGRWSADFYLFRNIDGPSFDDLVTPPELDDEDVSVPANRAQNEPKRKLKKRALAMGTSEEVSETCECGYDITNPKITVEPKYGPLAGFRFLVGISAPVKRVDFYCIECGTVIRRSRERDDLQKYRWHTT